MRHNTMAGCGCEVEIKSKEEGRALWALIAVNGVMFVVEGAFGLYAHSSGLMADSLDMLADAGVYATALYVVGRSAKAKVRSAYLSGAIQGVLGAGVVADAIRRFTVGVAPISLWMALISAVALAANIYCLKLLEKHKEGEVHMRATWIFTKNDVIANIGVMAAGGLVYLTSSAWPDLLVGLAIAAIVLRGSYHILRDAASESAKGESAKGDCG